MPKAEAHVTSNVEKEMVLHPIDTIYFSKLKKMVSKKLWQASTARLLRSEGTSDVPRSLMRSIQTFSEKTATILKRSLLVTHLKHIVQTIFDRGNKTWLIKDEHGSVGFPRD